MAREPISFRRDPTVAEAEVEQTVLALLIEGPETAWLVLDLISPEDMLEPLHQRIVQAVRRILDAGKDPTPLTIAAAMASDAALNSVGGTEYLRKLMHQFGGNRDIAKELCAALVDKAQKRALAREISLTEARLSDDSITAGDIIAEHQAALAALAEGRSSTEDPEPWFEFGGKRVDGLTPKIKEAALQPYGITEIDNEIGGMGAGDLIILGGRPGMGKTALALAIAYRAAKEKEQIALDLDVGKPAPPVGVFLSSLEMDRGAIMERGLSMTAYGRHIEIPYSAIRMRKVDEKQVGQLADVLMQDRDLPFLIDDRRGLTVGHIGIRMRRAQAKFARAGVRLGLGVIDHLGLIEPDADYRGNKVAEISAITRSLKILAGSLKIPLIVLCQLSRGVESREDKRPYLSDLRDSGSIEQDADVVLLIHRPEYYLRKNKPDDTAPPKERDEWERAMDREKNRLVVDVAKNRNGSEVTVRLPCHMAFNWVGERA